MQLKVFTTLIFFFAAGSFQVHATEEVIREKMIEYLELADKVSTALTSPLEEKKAIDELYILGSSLAESYFQFESEREFHAYEQLLFNSISAHPHLRIFFLPLGNALLTEAKKLIRKHEAEVRHYRIAASIGGAILGGLAGASYQLVQKTESNLRLALILSGSAGGATLGYFLIGPLASQIFIEVNPSIRSAEDFMARYPHAEDFLEHSTSEDLSLALDHLENDD